MNWHKGLKEVKTKVSLKGLTTFKIGGKARYFYRPRGLAGLKAVLRQARKHKIPVYILGAGSNILVADKGVNGLVVKLDTPYFSKITVQGNRIYAGSAVKLNQLVRKALEYNLAGAEFLAGIPGTVGGALAMNAGAWGFKVQDILENSNVLDYNSKEKNIKAEDIKFAYRSSELDKYIILSACFKLNKAGKKEIAGNVTKHLKARIASQDNSMPNAGSIFRNPSGSYAGKMIDACSLKGKGVGGAQVSAKHANFILNAGNARSADVLKLIGLIKNKVRNKFKVTLESEIKIWK